MKRTLVISDIHGEITAFNQLLSEINYEPGTDQLILLGDYVDRGEDSKAVLDKVMQLRELGAIVLKGNHEDMMIKALTSGEERPWRHWVDRNGGNETLRSYGFREEEYIVSPDLPFEQPQLSSDALKKHLEFICSLDIYIELDDFIFVHAGVHPETPIHETEERDFLWIRDPFHNGYSGEKKVVFGHTPTKYLYKDDTNHSIFLGENNIIGIDGGAVYGGQLNCLELPGLTPYSVKLISEEPSE
ncbi:serine/threonine protein phosphatase [Sporosarcina sp. NCCP-2222]|uniref:metallophosphoesterase family protein n=1 Tax=Sporosarcina sp. NCCP-2222 TaxID=2935073 RepID=UPI0020866926|nr:metallophosphoesterase family protein [Sporosarcina sp. NCCP-2222]GKV54677.1 serine/threonine protein phosphatase [Sporosarcina sp. NCCP-2222]